MSFRIFYDQNGQYAGDSVESVFGGEIFTDREEIYGTDGQLGYSVDSALAEVFCAEIILCWRTGIASAVQTALPMARRVWMTGDQDI